LTKPFKSTEMLRISAIRMGGWAGYFIAHRAS